MKPGKSDEWLTPPEIFKALNIVFDLDPCHPPHETFVPTKQYFTKSDDGLKKKWFGNVWLNPPFGGRNGYFPWIDIFMEHEHGLGLFTALTGSEGFHKYIPQMDAILFPKGKTRFYETLDKKGGCPFNGIVIFAKGEDNCDALKNSNYGMYFDIKC